MKDLSVYGIKKEKGRSYENITYVLALVYNQISNQVEDYLSAFGLTTPLFNVLMLAAYQNDGKGVTQAEMAKRLIASASNMTKLVEKAVTQGWLSRKTNPLSRRENIIRITVKGQKLIDKLWPEYDNLVRSLTNKIPSGQQKTAEEILNTWFENLQKDNK